MQDYGARIASIIGSAPADLVTFYRNAQLPVYPESRINCLPFDRAEECTRDMSGISVAERMGLWILDDANDSNPSAFISRGPCTGMIIHFSHDPEPQIAFSSLKRFLEAMHDAGQRGIDISEVEREAISIPLDKELRELAVEDTDDATFFLTTYLPISAALENETLTALVSHNDFFVREAFAAFLARTASDDYLALAEQLAGDAHPQVARQGKTALIAVKRKIYHG
jgi:hypothetical protein